MIRIPGRANLKQIADWLRTAEASPRDCLLPHDSKSRLVIRHGVP